MPKKILTEKQEEQILLTNPEILKLVKRAIKKTKQETAKQIFKELKYKLNYNQVSKFDRIWIIIKQVETKFLQEGMK